MSAKFISPSLANCCYEVVLIFLSLGVRDVVSIVITPWNSNLHIISYIKINLGDVDLDVRLHSRSEY